MNKRMEKKRSQMAYTKILSLEEGKQWGWIQQVQSLKHWICWLGSLAHLEKQKTKFNQVRGIILEETNSDSYNFTYFDYGKQDISK